MKQKLELAVSLIQQVIAELSSLEIRLPPEAEKRLADKICLNCGEPLGSQKVMRGCHEHCYHRINKSIQKSELTERQAIEQGILAPKAKSGRRRSSGDKLSELVSNMPIDMEPSRKRIIDTARSKRKKG